MEKQAFQQYELQGKLAEGGMATIYLGKQASLDRTVAVKILNPALFRDPQVRAAFEAEAVIISRLNHPHIVQVIDRGITEEGVPYFVMEYVKGVSLAQAITLNKLSLEQRFRIAIQVSQAIAYAHTNKVIHRDIKPDNVLIDMQGNAKILDFGIAVLDNGMNTQERDQLLAGTARYMAPELMQGKTRASEASDIFSLGFVLYELFAGVPPVAEAVLSCRALHDINPKLSPALDALVRQCLQSVPAKRPAAVKEIVACLLELSHGMHLATEQRHRIQQNFGKRSFILLDVLEEKPDHGVYLFEEKEQHTHVLVKKFQDNWLGFMENKRLAGLQHRHIVPVLGATRNEKVFIIAQPAFTGGSLQDRLVREFELQEFLLIARQICSGMLFAHHNGIVHGHLNPACIMFDDEGQVRIGDFALTEKKRHNTREDGMVFDLRDAGALFYQMLTGETSTIKNGRLKPASCFMRLPQHLQETISGMLGTSYRPFTSFAEVEVALNNMTDSLPTSLMQTPASRNRFAIPANMHQWLVPMALTAALLGLIAWMLVKM